MTITTESSTNGAMTLSRMNFSGYVGRAIRGGLGRLTAWHLPGGPVGQPAKWAATSNVEGGSGAEKGALS